MAVRQSANPIGGVLVAAYEGTFRVFSKADENYSLSISDGMVVLAAVNLNDDYQHWYKDEKFGNRVKDDSGFPAFALINKATGWAIRHSTRATRPVQLVPYNRNYLDETALWSVPDVGEGFQAIRMVSNESLNLGVFNTPGSDSQEETLVGTYEWTNGDNQKWKIVPN